jgi:cell division protein FtsB
MSDISDLLHWTWVAVFGVVSYFLKDLYGRFKEEEAKILKLQLEVQKQGAENHAMVKSIDQVSEALRDMNRKIDRLLTK